MKIAYIALRGVPLSDGIVQYTDDIARQLVKRGHEVTVYTSRRYGNKNGKYDDSYNIITVPSLPWGFAEKMSLVFFASLHQLFCKYDVVHYHAMGPSIFAFMGRRKNRVVIIQSHGVEYERGKYGVFAKKMLQWLEKWSINMGDDLIVCSNTLKKHFFEEYGKKTTLIYNAVEIPELKISNQNIFSKLNVKENEYYLYMARITEEKGLHYLINAFKKLKTDKKLVIAGPYDLNNEYHKKILGMAKDDSRIVFAGFVSGEDKANLIRGAYSFVLPSELEGFSIGLLEAMSYAKCCVISDISNNMEAAGDDPCCCIPFKDRDEKSLFEKLYYTEKHPEEIMYIGKLARDRIINNFSENTLVDSTEKLYLSLLKKRKQ